MRAITSAANPLVKSVRALGAKKYRAESGLFMVEGWRHVAEAMAAGWVPHILAFSTRAMADATFVDALKTLENTGDTDIVEVTEDILAKMTDRDNPQSVLGVFPTRVRPVTDVVSAITPSKSAVYVALEQVRDPGNLGTIIRTGDATGVDGIILVGDTCDPYTPECVRSTVGAFARVPVYAGSLEDLAALKPQVRMIGTHLDTDTDYRTADYSGHVVLLMGNEQQGLSPAAVTLCDTLVKIPMTGGVESLNLAVSTALMLYEIKRGQL